MRRLILIAFLFSTLSYGRAYLLCLSHSGNNKTEKINLIKIEEVSRNPQPSFKNKYGYYKLSIEKNGKYVFFTYFNSLFYEYSTTGKKEIKKFEECFFIPYVKTPFKIKICKLGKTIFETKIDNIKNTNTILKSQTKNEKVIKIAFISDGYKSRKDFLNDSKNLKEKFFSYKPYSLYIDKIKFTPIFVKNPGLTNKNTFGMKRYLTVSKVCKVYELLKNTNCDFFVVVTNSKDYGGSGVLNNFCCVTGKNNLSGFVLIHEFGHYFAGLGDEYFLSKTTYNEFYPKGFEPLEPNLTRETDRGKIKWKSLINKNTPIPTPPLKKYKDCVGLFEGGGYISKGIFRPQLHCIMKDRGYSKFCKVCEKTIEERIKSLLN
ncbi:hypothetical protein TTHT_0857 [Thermotomaculum hydrothermale]|uniref:Peptidase M64, IgA n=1 Tax=Thermotomaculum hydrothermale TaxID=981385 RepID=A0A7R6PEV5_9BACT|nr:M64 family metallopeptidase [Thermotomaculum hydrothermale]BBB32419.1 hypothetical protein TTHT_0857 [Thermotomaculum hydrothermale]